MLNQFENLWRISYSMYAVAFSNDLFIWASSSVIKCLHSVRATSHQKKEKLGRMEIETGLFSSEDRSEVIADVWILLQWSRDFSALLISAFVQSHYEMCISPSELKKRFTLDLEFQVTCDHYLLSKWFLSFLKQFACLKVKEKNHYFWLFWGFEIIVTFFSSYSV